jgi:hypothetical protein
VTSAITLPPFCSTGGLTSTAAAGLFFSTRVDQLAQRLADAIGAPFNGLHLRLERDMGLNETVRVVVRCGGVACARTAQWARNPPLLLRAVVCPPPGPLPAPPRLLQKMLPRYVAFMRGMSFDAGTPLHVASGLLTYNATAGEPTHGAAGSRLRRWAWSVGPRASSAGVGAEQLTNHWCSAIALPCPAALGRYSQQLLEAGVCSHVGVKEDVLPASELKGRLLASHGACESWWPDLQGTVACCRRERRGRRLRTPAGLLLTLHPPLPRR